MSSAMYGLVINLTLTALYAVLLLLVVQRVMEFKQFTYRVFRTSTGMKFEYSLGIYGGTVNVRRNKHVTTPKLIRKAIGWEIVLPDWYTDNDLSNYFMSNKLTIDDGNLSHINDLEVFKQVVLCKNDSLECINGKLFCTVKTD